MTEGVRAPVLGCDAPSQGTLDFAVFTQPGQLERMGSALAKMHPPLCCYLHVYSFHFSSRSNSGCAEGVRKGIPQHLGHCVGVDIRDVST